MAKKTVRLIVLGITLKETVNGTLRTFKDGAVFDHDDPIRAALLLESYPKNLKVTKMKTTGETAAAKSVAAAEQRQKDADEAVDSASITELEQKNDEQAAELKTSEENKTAAEEKAVELEEAETERTDKAQEGYDNFSAVLQNMTREELNIAAKLAGIEDKQIEAAKTKEDLAEVVLQAKAEELGFTVE